MSYKEMIICRLQDLTIEAAENIKQADKIRHAKFPTVEGIHRFNELMLKAERLIQMTVELEYILQEGGPSND